MQILGKIIKLLTKWNEPEEGVVAKNTAEVLTESAIIGFASVECIVVFTTLLTKFDCSVLVANEIHMKAEEGSDYQSKHACQDVGCHDKVSVFVVETLRIGHGTI